MKYILDGRTTMQQLFYFLAVIGTTSLLAQAFSSSCLLPSGQSAKKLNMLFYMFTNGTRSNPRVLYWNNITTSNTESACDTGINSKTTVIIIGGFARTMMKDFQFQQMKDKLLAQKEIGCVIYASWTSTSQINYFQVSANTRPVGKIVAQFINLLKIPPGLLHIVGHSLGAHVAGFAGQILNGSVARCTGLDPAGPCFRNNPAKNRLSSTDCQFVDVIHTNKNFLGLGTQIGCSDFYPNGGGFQTGCGFLDFDLNYNNITGKKDGQICSHQRSLNFFTASVNSDCQFVGVLSQNFDSFQTRKIGFSSLRNTSLAVMGYNAKPIAVSKDCQSFFLLTSGTGPYCVYQYLVTIEMAPEANGSPKTDGIVTLDDRNGISFSVYKKVFSTDTLELYSGTTMTYISVSPSKFKPNGTISVSWNEKNSRKTKTIHINCITITALTTTNYLPQTYCNKEVMLKNVSYIFNAYP